METREKHKLLDCIGEVYEKAKNCELKEGFFTEQKAELNILSDYFGTTKSQSFFIAIVFTLNYKGDTVDLNDMIEYFGCNPMKLLEFNEDFNYLQSKAYLKKKLSKHRVQVAGANNQFTVNEKLCEAILKNEPVPELKNAISDIFELLEEICELGKQRDNDEINTLGLYKLVIKLLEEHKELTLIQKIEPFELSVDDKLLYFYLIWKTITGRETCNVERALEAFFDRETKRVYYMQDLVDGNNALLEHKLIEIIPTKFLNNTEIILTETSNVLLKECGITVSRSKKNKDNIWSPADI
ncbi:hypothetical protein LB452_00700 [Psychroflexus sp. CAK8W]|uniref:Uncharacterized protein n=1 Tax=Psychroflexus longus TaxID=2873596 RepID=A0ABS7XEQ7_9FLAO|nr:hypothetical protein [Psychroflexus longus]MBZ9777427.1 hypothetical protein [Psychroflexus longus]